MTVGLRLFISSGVFAIAIAVAYWVSAHEVTGTFLLGFLAFALSVIAGYMIVAERQADLLGDRAGATQRDGASQLIGTYSTHSPLPIWTAVALSCVLFGIVVSPTLAVLGVLAVLALGAAFVVQSR